MTQTTLELNARTEPNRPQASTATPRTISMADDKISISWDDLQTRRVDNRLREQGAMERNRAYAKMQEESLPASAPPAPPSIWTNAIFCMTVFGLLGGLLAFGASLLVAGPLTPVIGSMLNYQPGAEADAQKRLADVREMQARLETHQLDEAEGRSAIEVLRLDGQQNPYFALLMDDRLSDKQREARMADRRGHDQWAQFVIDAISYGLCGVMIAACLAMAEPLSGRKFRAAWINGLAGAAAGAAGGVAAALLSEKLAQLVGSVTDGQAVWVRKLISDAAVWSALGLFLGLGSGVVLRNMKKLMVGMVGGLVGGAIGGTLCGLLAKFVGSPDYAKLIALICIGVVAGLSTGLLENAIKAGWLKVTSGIIAGKQFILYRNPTYIGSSPDCQIYLFKDPQVGKRHAAIHLMPAGIEIEDLPLGTATLINGRPVTRTRLKAGDTIQIGATSFLFQEKRPAPGQ